MVDERVTYTPAVPDNLVRVVGADAALLAVRLASFADEFGQVRVSADYLCEIFGWSGNSLRNYAKKLAVLHIWTRVSGTSRAHVSLWKKGANFDTYVSLKRVQNLEKKGANFAPKKEIRINNAHACARGKSATQRDKKAAVLPIYRNGDQALQPEMIDSMVKVWHADRLGYVFEKDLQQVLAAGAELFNPKNK